MNKTISTSLVLLIAALSTVVAEISVPTLVGVGRDPAWSPDGGKIAFLQRVGEEDRLMVKELDAGREERHIYTAPIVRFAWLNDSTIATQERKMPAIEGGRLKVSRIMKVPLRGQPETVAFDSVYVTEQNDRSLRLKTFADGSVGYYDDAISFDEALMLCSATTSDTTKGHKLFVRSVPGIWGKVWLYYDTFEQGKQVTRDDNTFSLPRLSPMNDRIMCKNHRGQLIVFDTLGFELANLGRTDMESWSPDGNHIVFCRSEYGHYDIKASDLWIANYDGSEIRQLTDTPDVIEAGGVFSPNGRYLAYTNERTSEVYVIELN